MVVFYGGRILQGNLQEDSKIFVGARLLWVDFIGLNIRKHKKKQAQNYMREIGANFYKSMQMLTFY